jgi:hypothetical protein
MANKLTVNFVSKINSLGKKTNGISHKWKSQQWNWNHKSKVRKTGRESAEIEQVIWPNNKHHRRFLAGQVESVAYSHNG